MIHANEGIVGFVGNGAPGQASGPPMLAYDHAFYCLGGARQVSNAADSAAKLDAAPQPTDGGVDKVRLCATQSYRNESMQVREAVPDDAAVGSARLKECVPRCRLIHVSEYMIVAESVDRAGGIVRSR